MIEFRIVSSPIVAASEWLVRHTRRNAANLRVVILVVKIKMMSNARDVRENLQKPSLRRRTRAAYDW